MNRAKLRIIVCLAASLFMLLALPSLTNFTSKSAYAMGWKPPPPDPGQDDGGRGYRGRGDRGGGRHSSSPEPATWLLIGSGLGGLALYRKIRKK